MIYPLVKELAGDGIPVMVTCRVLKLTRAPYYRWLASPVTDREWEQAHTANALFDAHCLAPGLMEALIPREDESHGGTEEVSGRVA